MDRKSNDDRHVAIREAFIAQLSNIDVPHSRLMVMFSAPPSTGKSRLAKILERELQGLRIENDSLRTLLTEYSPDLTIDQKNEIVYRLVDDIRADLLASSPNGLWIVDSNIDVHYRQIFEFAEAHGFKRFVISLDIPEDIHRQWIIRTGDRPFAPVQKYLERMPLRRKQHAEFLEQYTPDMALGPDYDQRAVVERVRKALELICLCDKKHKHIDRRNI